MTCGMMTPPTDISSDGPVLLVTDKAIAKVKEFANGNPGSQGKCLRVYIEGGGCSGFQYGFAFDDKQSDDVVVDAADIQVVVDPMSLPYLRGSTVDFVEAMTGAGFTVNNPNAKSACGCGTSFSV